MKSVKIGWKEYEIVEAEINTAMIEDPKECYGEIDYNKCKIYLNANYDEKIKQETLLHEILHGITDMYDLDMSENFVTRLSNALFTAIKDNNILINQETA